MSQRGRRSGSPVPTAAGPLPPGCGSSGAVPGVGSPPPSGLGMGSGCRPGPMKATVPFQLRQHQHQQTVSPQPGRTLHVPGGGHGSKDNNTTNNINSNTANNNGKLHEANSSCVPGERGGRGGARTPAATSHSRSPARPPPFSATADSPSLPSPPSLTPLDRGAGSGSPDSQGFSGPSFTAALLSSPSPGDNISSSTSSSSSSSLLFTHPQAPLLPCPSASPTPQTVLPLLSTQANNCMVPRGHATPSPPFPSPPCSSPPLPSSAAPHSLQGSSSSTPAPSPLVSTSASPTAPSSRLVSQSASPCLDSPPQAVAERSCPPSPTGERIRHTLLSPSSSSSSAIHRTSSLDALAGPYLAGHWPRDVGHAPCCVPCMKDKSTQTPSEWVDDWMEEEEERRRSHHKRSASWGSNDQLKEIAKLRQQLQRCKHGNRHHRDKDRKTPFNSSHGAIHQPQAPVSRCVLLPLSLVPKTTVSRFRNSLEGLNQEIEKITITHCKPQDDIPDGRRAPPPVLAFQSQSRIASPLCQSQSAMVSRTVDTQTTNSASNPANASVQSDTCSRAQSVSPFMLSVAREGEGERRGEEEVNLCPSDDQLMEGEKDQHLGSPLPKFSCSPKPNNSYMFQREPPEGCERVRVFTEDTHSKLHRTVSPVFPGGPDRNKVNFIPNDRGSAFSTLRKTEPRPLEQI